MSKDYQEEAKLVEEFQKLSLPFVVGEGAIEHHAKLSNFFLEALTTYGNSLYSDGYKDGFKQGKFDKEMDNLNLNK